MDMSNVQKKAEEVVDKREGEGLKRRKLKGISALVVRVIGIAAVLLAVIFLLDLLRFFHIHLITISYRGLFAGLLIALAFLVVPPTKRARRDKIPWYDIILAALGFVSCFYIFLNGEDVIKRAGFANPTEVVLGSMGIILFLEACRRTIGWIMVGLGIGFLLYAPFSNFFPGILHGRGYPIERVIGHMYLWEDGIFGLILGVFSSIVVVYILFGQLLFAGGAGKFITDMAMAMAGHIRGGPAKAAVIASMGFGTISGSATGNVSTTGIITIPLMKKIGYKPHFAGAVEAVASTGGALMPPVMGTVAFLMADFLDISYNAVVIMAIWPAILYYLSVYMQVDFEAAKMGLRGTPRSELPPIKKTLLTGWHFIIPIGVLLYFLIVLRYSAVTCAFYAMAALLVVSFFRKETRLGFKKILSSIDGTANILLPLIGIIGSASLIVASFALTGLGIRLSQMLVALSGGNLLLLLILVGIINLILGTELPWSACYILLASLAAPALVMLGVDVRVAHMFILYTGLFSFITPPFCVAAYTGAIIAEANPFTTGLQATRLGIVAFIVPFIFVYEPALLMMAPVKNIIQAMITSTIGVIGLAAGVEGFLLKRANWLQRIALIAGGILLIIPGWRTDVMGVALLLAMLLWQKPSLALSPVLLFRKINPRK